MQNPKKEIGGGGGSIFSWKNICIDSEKRIEYGK